MLGRRGMVKFLMKKLEGKVEKAATRAAGGIKKEDFLKQLEQSWYPFIRKDADTQQELTKAKERIAKSGPFKKTFEVVGITDEELLEIIKRIQDSKPVQEVNLEPAIGRNQPCPCGSGKKYKKCCMRTGEEANRKTTEEKT